MEEISEVLQPHKDAIGTVATVVTILQFFAGIFICRDVYRKQSTKDISAMPFIGGLVIGILVLKYAIMLNDKAMFQVNIAAIFLNAIYLIFYYFYSYDKWDDIFKTASIGVGLIAIMLSYISYEDTNLIEYRYGVIVTALMLALMGAPLLEINDIIGKKDASSIPFALTFMGCIVSGLWLLYGCVLMNYFMIIQNITGMVLCAVQLILIFIYPGGQSAQSTQKGTKKKSKQS